MRLEVNLNQFQISLWGNISLRCKINSLYQRSHDLWQSETHFGANFTSFNLTNVKCQTAVIFQWIKVAHNHNVNNYSACTLLLLLKKTTNTATSFLHKSFEHVQKSLTMVWKVTVMKSPCKWTIFERGLRS